MATLKFFVSAEKRELAPIYVRLSDGRKCDLIVKSGLLVEPERWSNKTETIKQRITTKEDDKLTDKLDELRKHINKELKFYSGTKSKDWLTSVINRFHNIREDEGKTLNGYIASFINKAEAGELKNNGAVNFSLGTVRAFKGFQRIFNEYQGIYTDKRIEQLHKEEKPLRPLKLMDFEDITVDFYRDFVSFLSNEGYEVNTIGRFIKELKYIMRKALSEKKHTNREFMEGAFSGFSEDSFSVYLTMDEVERIYKHDLSKFPRMELARDAFIVLCETALRISDYHKIELNIRDRNRRKYIYIQQSKTGDLVVIPLTSRMEAILKKYNGQLPKIHEVYVNKYIKTVASWCKIDQVIRWDAKKNGLKFTKSAKKYELITCHTGRRTACTNMYLSGIKPIDIMKISGHRTESMLLKYIRISPEETAERLASHSYFNGSNLKAV